MSDPDAITAEPLTPEAFAPFGEVLEVAGAPTRIINQGKCGRYHDLAVMDFTPDAGGRPGICLFHAELRPLPYSLDLTLTALESITRPRAGVVRGAGARPSSEARSRCTRW